MSTITTLGFLLLIVACGVYSKPKSSSKWAGSPNIIFIMADDLGWNDVGFHGSNQIPTPNIDALAYSGLILQNYYVNPICTPSRSAFMTGRYPIHTGMQHTVLFGAEPRGLPLNERLLPEFLKPLGYVNRIVGKWHLGSYKKEYTPTYRGFLSHLGCWTGHLDYNDHTAMERPGWGLDMRRNLDVDYDSHGKYVTDLYTNEAVKLISEHNVTRPLFLYLAHNAVHSGNPYNPLAAPDDLIAKFTNITDYNRQRFAGVLTKLDESVGKVVSALQKRNMLKNSLIVFSTDNGGPAEGFNINAASNWPLRGVKNTLWEGGVRGAGLIWSPNLEKRKRVATQRMHIVDWFPTLLRAAAGQEDLKDSLISNSTNLKLDGLDLWEELSKDLPSKRQTILHNIDNIYGSSSLMVEDWKLIKGTNYQGAWDYWYGPSGRSGVYDFTSVLKSPVALALAEINMPLDRDDVLEQRSKASFECPNDKPDILCEPLKSPCLFNIKEDPCEKRNVAKLYPDIVQSLEHTLSEFNKTSVPPGNRALDPRGNPKLWNYVWTNFGDYVDVKF